MEMTHPVKKASPVSTLILLVIGVDALVIVAACALDRVSQANPSWLLIPAAIALTTVVLRSRQRLGDSVALALNDLVAVSAAVMIAPAVAVLAVATNHLLFCRSKREATDRVLFRIAGSVVAMNAATHATAAAFASFGQAQNEMTATAMLAASLFCAVFYFSLATALSALYQAFSTDDSLVTALKDSVLWSAGQLLFTRPALLSVYLMRQWNYDNSRQPHKSRIGETLVSRGLITPAHLQSALERQRGSADRAKRLGEILVEMGVIEERQVLNALTGRAAFASAAC
ncbi:MAG: hypothetical protein ACJ74J_00805 [Blastocatellia bacterium]